MNRQQIKIGLSKQGIPCFWERGGGMTNTGEAVIIGNREAQPKVPIYIKQKGHLSNGKHALIPISVSDLVINVFRHHTDYIIGVYRIIEIDRFNETAFVEQINEFSNGEWDSLPSEELLKMSEVSVKKSLDYHCREPYFIKEEK